MTTIRRPWFLGWCIVLAAGLAAAAPPASQPAPELRGGVARGTAAELLQMLRARQFDRADELLKRRLPGGDANLRQSTRRQALGATRVLIAGRDYWTAQRTCDLLLKHFAQDAEILELRALLASAGEQAARGVPQANELLKLELHEPAAQRLLEAVGFREGPGDLAAPLAKALRGAGDENYRARNYGQAMAAYGQYLRLVPGSPEEIRQRWLQCMVETLAARPLGARLTQDDWLALMAQAGPILQAKPNEVLGKVLAGMMLEDTAETLRPALDEYAQAVGQPVDLPEDAAVPMTIFRGLRQAAFDRARGQFAFPKSFDRTGLWATTLDGPERTIEGPLFVIRHRNAFAAQQVAAAMAYHLPRLAEHLGIDTKALRLPPVTVNLYGDAETYRRDEQAGVGEPGRTRLRYVNGKLSELEIGVYQRDPSLLSATIPHELTHLLLASAFKQNILPTAVEEGLALHSEPTCRHTQMRRILRQMHVDASGRVDTPALTVLLLHRTHPEKDPLRFYAASYACVSFLAGQGPVSKIVATAGGAANPSDLKIWATAYGYADPIAFQQAFETDFRALVGRAVTTAP